MSFVPERGRSRRLSGAIRAERAWRARQSSMDKPASFATCTMQQTLIDGSCQKQMLVGRADNSGARGFGCWLWISRPRTTSSSQSGCG